MAILEHAVGIPHELAVKCVDPLRVFAFFCFTGTCVCAHHRERMFTFYFSYAVAVRSSLTGWLTLHRQTKLVTPRGFFRLGSVVAVFFAFRALG